MCQGEARPRSGLATATLFCASQDGDTSPRQMGWQVVPCWAVLRGVVKAEQSEEERLDEERLDEDRPGGWITW